MNKILLVIAVFSLVFASCSRCSKEKEVKKVVKKEVVKKPVIKDTLVPPPPPPVEEPVIEEPVNTAPNKYFLIAGSFEVESNAYKLRDELIEQGFDSEVIVRKTGLNEDFYKVSYKGFNDRDDAFHELALERQQPNNEDVWLLIK